MSDADARYADFSPEVAGIVAVAVLSLVLTGFLLFCYSQQHHRKLLIYSRTWFIPHDQRPPDADLGLAGLLKLPQPFSPDIKDTTVSDEELFLRFLVFIAKVLALYSIVGCVVVLCLVVIGVPELRPSSEPLFYSGDQRGRFPSIDQVSLNRLFRAYDLDQGIAGAQAPVRYGLLAAFCIVTSCIAAFFCKTELDLVAKHRRRFLNELPSEVGFFDTRHLKNWAGIGEDKARWIAAKCGLQTPASYGSTPHPLATAVARDEASPPLVHITGLHAIPNTKAISKILKQRTATIQELEGKEVQYICSFTPIPDGEGATEELPLPGLPRDPGNRLLPSIASSIKSPSRRRDLSDFSDDSPEPSAFPSHTFTIRGQPTKVSSTAHPNARKRKLSEPLLDAVGKRMQGGGAFVELFQPAHSHSDQLYECEMTALGSSVKVDGSGRFVTLPQTPRASMMLGSGEAGSSQVPQLPEMSRAESCDTFSGSVLTAVPESPETPIPRRGVSRASGAPVSDSRSSPTVPQRILNISDDSDRPHTSASSSRPADFSASIRPVSGVTPLQLQELHNRIRQLRSDLKRLDGELLDTQDKVKAECEEGSTNICGYMVIGKGLRCVPHVSILEGNSRDDALWARLGSSRRRSARYWLVAVAIGGILCGSALPVAVTTVTNLPGVASVISFLRPVTNQGRLALGIFTCVVPALLFSAAFTVAQTLLYFLTGTDSMVSKTTLKANQTQGLITIALSCAVFFALAVAAVFGSVENIQRDTAVSNVLAQAAVSTSTLWISVGIIYALLAPTTLLVKPLRYLSSSRALLGANSPRQRFVATFPATITRSSVISCVFVMVFAATLYAFIQPLVVVAPLIMVGLLIPVVRQEAHYSAVRATKSGGLHELIYLQVLMAINCAPPFLLGLLLISRQQWTSAGVLLGSAVLLACAAALCSYRAGKANSPRIDADTEDRIKAFVNAGEAGEPDTPTGQKQAKRSSLAALLPGNRRSWASLMDAFANIPAEPPRRRIEASFLSEMIDVNATPYLAARAHEFAAPRLEAEDDNELEIRASLQHPSLVVPQAVVWLPSGHELVGGEVDDCRLWGLKTAWKETVPFDTFNIT